MRIRALWGALLGFSISGCESPPDSPGSDLARRAEVELQFSEIEARFPTVPVIDPAELRSLWELGNAALVVDVRCAEERAVSRIAGAIDTDTFEARGAPGAGTVVVVYCTIGERSARIARAWRRRGVDARNLRGGILAWVHSGGAMLDPRGESVRRAHVYGPPWSLLPEGWEAVH